MTTQISTKLAALGVALILNVTMIGAVAYLFNGQLHDRVPTSLASASAPIFAQAL